MNFCKTLQASINAEGIWSDGESRAMSLLLLEEVAGLSTADVLMERDDALSEESKAQLRGMAARISKGEPVQYVLGFQRFCGLKIVGFGTRTLRAQRLLLSLLPRSNQRFDGFRGICQSHRFPTLLWKN